MLQLFSLLFLARVANQSRYTLRELLHDSNYENDSEETTIHLNFLLEQHRVGGSRRIQGVGVITENHLRWNSHVNCVVVKANRMLGLIKRTGKGLNDLKTLRTLYCSLVRTNPEYCSVVWSPYSRKNIDKLEGVQRRAEEGI